MRAPLSRRLGCLISVVLLLAAGAMLTGYGLWLATSDPVVRHLDYRAPGWPKRVAPVRIVLATDLHVSDLRASRARVARVVARIDAQKPDIILLGGDFVGGMVQDHPEKTGAALLPLRNLQARLGVFAVLGNHDHWTDPAVIREALHTAGIRVLSNMAATAGPIVIGGIDDQYSGSARLIPTELSILRRKGLPVLLAHSPDVFPYEQLPIALTLVGHTHCGQIALPFFGAIVVPSHFGIRYACGVYREGGRTLVVSGGIGTSQIPMRLFAPSDFWVIDIGPG